MGLGKFLKKIAPAVVGFALGGPAGAAMGLGGGAAGAAVGNATLFSPHDSVTNEWIFRSKHTPTGKVLRIDVEKMLRFINDHFGLDMIQEFTEE